jgi:hypothetical protein
LAQGGFRGELQLLFDSPHLQCDCSLGNKAIVIKKRVKVISFGRLRERDQELTLDDADGLGLFL